jgi:Fe2+ or Zn2+ uptake regulation protein
MDTPRAGLPGAGNDEHFPVVDWRLVGLRRTPQREVVLRLIQNCPDHPTAEWIHREARRELPDISLATVYRTLRILKEKGLIHEFSGGASPSRFDGARQRPHEHVRCVRCGEVADVELPEASEIRRLVARRSGYRIERYPLLFQGLCSACSGGTNGPLRGADPDDPDRRWEESHW